MEYKTDKRTMNLTLRDIHIGDWVQVWSKETECYSPPMEVIGINYDGTVYLAIDEESRCDPWEEDISCVDALPISPEVLEGFGFDVPVKTGLSRPVYYDGQYIGIIKVRNFYSIGFPEHYEATTMSGLITYLSENYPQIKLRWKGI